MKNAISRRGFSLMEVVVVITITAVMVSVSVPALQQTRGNSGKNQCRKNLQQIGLASYSYAEDNGGFLVPWVERSRMSLTWEDMLRVYLEGIDRPFNGAIDEGCELLYCPTRRAMGYDLSNSGYWTNYVINMNVHGLQERVDIRRGIPVPNLIRDDTGETTRLHTIDEFINTSSIATHFEQLLYDFSSPHNYSVLMSSLALIPRPDDPVGVNSNFSYVHKGKTNILFLDGHVGSTKEAVLFPDVLLHDGIHAVER